MRYILVLIGLLIVCQGKAQHQAEGTPISISYYGPYLIQPGLKIGTDLTLKNWQSTREKGDNSFILDKKLLISPQVGFFVRSGNNTNYFVNTEIGFKRHKISRKSYLAFWAGLGYQFQIEVLSFTVDLSTGETVAWEKENRHYFLSALSGEYGGHISPKIGWFSKYTIGIRTGGDIGTATLLAFELGAKIFLSKKENQ